MRPFLPNPVPLRAGGPGRPAGLRRAQADGAWMRVAAIAGTLLLVAAVAWMHVRVGQDQRLQEEAAAAMTDTQVRALLERAAEAGGPTGAGADRWAGALGSGGMQAEDLMLRVFTGTDYLVSGSSDRDFARDAHYVRTGQEPDKTWLDRADVFFTNGGSRITFLENVPEIPVIPAPEGSVQSFSVTAGFPKIGVMTVGIATAEGQCRLDDVQARVMLYVDDRLRSGPLIAPPDQTFEVAWDTRDEDPGTHAVVVLLRSSDGRGRVVEQGSFTIPRVQRAPDGTAFEMELVGNEQWYYLTPDTRDVLFNANSPSGDIAVDLYGLDGGSLLSCDNRGLSHETLRLRGENGAAYYARVKRGIRQTDLSAVSYTVTVSEASLKNPSTGQVLAVRTLDKAAGTATAADALGRILSYALSDMELIEYTARLSALELLLPDGSAAGLYPAFDRGITEYGLVLPAGLNLDAAAGLSFFAEAQEGSSAGLEIVNHLESGVAESQSPEGRFTPARSENRLAIRITGYDGSINTYNIHILYGPHSGQYDVRTLNTFPSDYRSGLWLLHVANPAYVFEPYDTGIAWIDFIDVQDETNKSLIQSGKVPDSWIEPDSPVYDGTAWKAALRPVIEYYADPRNFLRPETLFQFEKLDYIPDIQTLDGVKAILKGTFMDRDLDTFADIFMRAGSGAGISPYFLASRAIQEMGANGESQLAHGTLQGYEGYYNYFNIGSYPNPSVPLGQRINGALFAMYGNDPDLREITPDETAVMIPWDTAEKSILGGAIFIARRYVAAGQNTLYFQKFDVIPESGLYTKQYAQNIQMAWAEGLRYYTAYRDIGLGGSPFVFRIPYYRGMPNDLVKLPLR